MNSKIIHTKGDQIMQIQMNEFLFSMILTELEDAVGVENCSVRQIDKVTHSVDY